MVMVMAKHQTKWFSAGDLLLLASKITDQEQILKITKKQITFQSSIFHFSE
jgi:hypothetical protein